MSLETGNSWEAIAGEGNEPLNWGVLWDRQRHVGLSANTSFSLSGFDTVTQCTYLFS